MDATSVNVIVWTFIVPKPCLVSAFVLNTSDKVFLMGRAGDRIILWTSIVHRPSQLCLFLGFITEFSGKNNVNAS